MRGLGYRQRWERCRADGWYDYQLEDGSLFQFRYGETSFSLSFLQCPYQVTPFEDFAYERLGDGWEVFEEELREEYEIFQMTDISERSVTPVRYDYDPALYRAGVHPAGHIHMGVDNNVRIAARKVLNPLSFAMFVVRQHYPDKWEKFGDHPEFIVRVREVRESLDDVVDAFFQQKDHCEMFLY
jgi:hypothetical protein